MKEQNWDEGWKDAEARRGIDTAGDPLEEFRTDKDGTPMSKSYNDEAGVLTEEEELVEKNDPKFRYWKDVEDLSNEEAFAHMAKGFDIKPEEQENLIDDFEEYSLNDELLKRKAARKLEAGEGTTDTPELLTYSVEELTLMQQCARYKDIMNLPPHVRKEYRPEIDGKAMTDEAIAEQLAQYKSYNKREGQWYLIKKTELELMKDCAAWDRFYRAISNEANVTTPVDANGAPLSEKEIDEVAAEYHAFRREKPEEFAKLKYEKGEWRKEHFAWNEGEHKGKKEWYTVAQEEFVDNEGTPLGNKKTKYTSKKEPFDNYGEYYFTASDSLFVSDDGNVVYVNVDLKYPTKQVVVKAGQQKIA